MEVSGHISSVRQMGVLALRFKEARISAMVLKALYVQTQEEFVCSAVLKRVTSSVGNSSYGSLPPLRAATLHSTTQIAQNDCICITE